MDRSVDVIAGYLAILSVGALYFPIDLNQPRERLEFLLKDAKPSVVLLTRQSADRLPAGVPAAYVEEADRLAPTGLEMSGRSHPQGIACLLYTSGSTGVPKGVLIPDAGIVRLVTESDFIPFGSHLRFLLHSQLPFDASTLEIFAPLLNGGTCVLFHGENIATLHEFREAIRRFRVNTVFFGPAIFNLAIEENPDVLEGLAYLIQGGEALSPNHIRKCLELFPHMHLVNGYGPTETTTFATTYKIPRNLAAGATSVPIGKPIARTQTYIFDESGKLITDDRPGELLIGGSGVALGYLNRPEMTAERFVPDPFSTDPQARLYRTGDLCRWLPDGNLDFINRLDFQVKIRGQRVEPGEIEAAMQQHSAIGQSVVIARGQSADKYLVGFYTLARGQTCTAAELRQHLQRHLPTYLVPEKLIALETMPATRNGKVDRRALPDDVPVVQISSRQPTSPLEKDLAELWKRSLGVEQIGLDDCFFELGGSSLGMMRLCTQIQQRTNRFVSVNTFLSATTVGKMADILARPQQSNDSSLIAMLKPGDGEPLFCAPGHGGHPLFFRPLSQRLTWPGPIYGLQFPGLDGTSAPAQSVEEMAARFIAEIRSLAPDQRYHLIGYSFGGLITFEMGRRMRADGDEIGSTILLDAFTSTAGRSRPPIARIAIHVKRFLRKSARARFQHIKPHRNADQEIPESAVTLMPHIEQVNQLNRRAYDNYRPGPHDGDVTLIQAMERPDWIEFCIVDPTGGWGDFVKGKLEIKQCPGNHLTMMEEPHLPQLADILNQSLSVREMEPALPS